MIIKPGNAVVVTGGNARVQFRSCQVGQLFRGALIKATQ